MSSPCSYAPYRPTSGRKGNSLPQWLVQLIGDRPNLRRIEDLAPLLGCTVVWDRNEAYLHCEEDDCRSAADTREYAQDRLVTLNACAGMTAEHHVDVQTGDVDREDDDGGRQRVVFADTGQILFRGYQPTIDRAENASDILSINEKAVKVIVSNGGPLSGAIQQFMQKPCSWLTLTKALEILVEDRNLQNKLVKRLCSQEEIKRFTETANDPNLGGDLARHGKSNGRYSKHSAMTLEEGRELVRRILCTWISQRFDQLQGDTVKEADDNCRHG